MLKKAANGANYLFNHERIRAFLVRFRYPVGAVFVMLALPQIEPGLLFPGFLVSLFGEAIQIWSLASLDKNNVLAVNGPYSLTRNPMYIGRFFLLLGGVLLAGNILILLVFLTVYYFYLVNRVKREEANLHNIFGHEYESYCSEVNRFVPSFKRGNLRSVLHFKRNLFFKNNAHWNLLGVLFTYLLFYFITLIKIGAR